MLCAQNSTVNTLPHIEKGNKQVNKVTHTIHTKCWKGNKGVLLENIRAGRRSILVRILKEVSSGKLAFKV